MSAGFTPGPWQTNCSHIYAPDGAIIATVSNPGTKASDYPLVSNRDLMAAAPELYEALRDLLASLSAEERYAQRLPIVGRAEAVLAKARGEQ